MFKMFKRKNEKNENELLTKNNSLLSNLLNNTDVNIIVKNQMNAINEIERLNKMLQEVIAWKRKSHT